MTYTPRFDPTLSLEESSGSNRGYVYPERLALAVDVARTTNRPLLLRGGPGSGKSSLARDVAQRIGSRHEEVVISSHTQARDLLYRFDAVRRLSDAQARVKKPDAHYVEPGVLWRAFDGPGARRLHSGALDGVDDDRGVVVLLDEVDKADPDVPNDLLVVLDDRWFHVPELSRRVEARPGAGLFLVITTNGERDLPLAFLRRCVVFEIQPPLRADLEKIVRAHFPDRDEVSDALVARVLDAFEKLADHAKKASARAPSPAEVLDAVTASVELKAGDLPEKDWLDLMETAMWKNPARPARP